MEARVGGTEALYEKTPCRECGANGFTKHLGS